MNSCIELVSFRLTANADPQSFKHMQPQLNQWLQKQKGFYYRTLVKEESEEYLDIVHWASESEAKTAAEKLMQQDFFHKIMAMIDENSVKMRHTQSLSEIGSEQTAQA